ncbi:MAG: hypothetical protein ABUT20_30380 [Bacteroidota bacterium]
MKIRVIRRTAGYIACCVLLTSMIVTVTGCSSSVPLTSKNVKVVDGGNFSFDLQPIANSSKIQLVVLKPLGKRVWVTFKSPDGYVIERYCTPETGLGVYKYYNFTDAAEGIYSFEIGDRSKTVTKTVKLQTTTEAIQHLTVGEN